MSENTETKARQEVAASPNARTTNNNGAAIDGKKNNDGNGAATTNADETKTQPDAENAPESQNSEKANAGKPEKSGFRKRLPLIVIGSLLIIAAVSGIAYWLTWRNYETTDDAFVEADIVQVSPKVAAYVNKVHVKDNQQVKKGDLLVELDPRDYEARLAQARAQLQAAEAQRGQATAGVALTRRTTTAGSSQATSNIQTARSNVDQARAAAVARKSGIAQAASTVKTAEANLAQTRAQVPQAQANLQFAQIEFNRRQELFNRGDVSKQTLDQATTNLQTAQAQLDAANKAVEAAASRIAEARANVNVAEENYRQSVAQINVAQSQVNESAGRQQDAEAAPERIAVNEAQIGTAEGQIAQAQAAVRAAELDLSNTKIFAPEDGLITRKTVQEGQLVQPGAALMALTQSDVWVTANFKETQLDRMQVGQSVEIKVDAYPNTKFKAHIDSFQAGTGARFSVLPPENATGNYVKVVQRIPVKIVFDEQPDDNHRLAPGMSAQPVVKVR